MPSALVGPPVPPAPEGTTATPNDEVAVRTSNADGSDAHAGHRVRAIFAPVVKGT